MQTLVISVRGRSKLAEDILNFSIENNSIAIDNDYYKNEEIKAATNAAFIKNSTAFVSYCKSIYNDLDNIIVYRKDYKTDAIKIYSNQNNLDLTIVSVSPQKESVIDGRKYTNYSLDGIFQVSGGKAFKREESVRLSSDLLVDKDTKKIKLRQFFNDLQPYISNYYILLWGAYYIGGKTLEKLESGFIAEIQHRIKIGQNSDRLRKQLDKRR